MPVLLRPEQFEPASWRGMGQMLEGRVQSFSQIQLGLAVPVTDSSGDGTSHLLVLQQLDVSSKVWSASWCPQYAVAKRQLD